MFSLSRIGEILKHLPRGAFDRIVEKHKADRYVKRFGCRKLLVTMIYAHLSEARSLRHVLKKAAQGTPATLRQIRDELRTGPFHRYREELPKNLHESASQVAVAGITLMAW